MDDVLARVAQLLGGQRALVPARVARGLADAAAEDRAEQVSVAGLGTRADEPGRDLGVEEIVDLRAPGAAEDRDVLAARVEHDLDRGVREQLGERRHVDILQRVDQHDSWLAAGTIAAPGSSCARASAQAEPAGPPPASGGAPS